MTFETKLTQIQRSKETVLCVGLDPDLERIPSDFRKDLDQIDRILAFNRAIVKATAPYACAFKLNFAFYERFGSAGWSALEETLKFIPEDTLTIADNKRGDIGNSARFYAQSVFETMDVDACTVSPYMGMDTIEPFLNYPGKAVFILARTSNPGAADLQEQPIGSRPLYEVLVQHVAKRAPDSKTQMGLVVGATSGEALSSIRSIVPRLPLLIPGVGAQGGDTQTIMDTTYAGWGSVLVNSSRSILYAGDSIDFAQKSALEAIRLKEALKIPG